MPWWEKLGKWARRRPAAAGLIVVTLAAGASSPESVIDYYRDLEDHNSVLEDRNTTISRNIAELEERNATITQKSRDLELANAATIKERDRAEENLVGALEAVDGLLSSMGLTARRPRAAHRQDPRSALQRHCGCATDFSRCRKTTPGCECFRR